MIVEKTKFSGVLIIQPKLHIDSRGYFYECWQQEKYLHAGIKEAFVQDNISSSERAVLRGLHYQCQHPLGQLIYLSQGKIFDVAVDLRRTSPTFKQWMGLELDAAVGKQIYWPPGFAHGYCVLSDVAVIHYKCTNYYYPEDEGRIAWNDPELNISWPIQAPIISSNDNNQAMLQQLIATGKLPDC